MANSSGEQRGNPFEARDGCFKVAAKKNQNNPADLLGQVRFWNDHFYVGTFSEYDMGAIRARADRPDPHGLARG